MDHSCEVAEGGDDGRDVVPAQPVMAGRYAGLGLGGYLQCPSNTAPASGPATVAGIKNIIHLNGPPCSPPGLVTAVRVKLLRVQLNALGVGRRCQPRSCRMPART